MDWTYAWLALGLVGIWYGSELVVHHAVELARKLDLPETVIGLSILSVGTSLPEIATHLVSSINILRGIEPLHSGGVALGTNIGSNIIQITLITGVVALLGTLKCQRDFLRRDYMVMLCAIVLLIGMSLPDGQVARWEGWVLVLLYGLYLWRMAHHEDLRAKVSDRDERLWRNLLVLALGLGLLGVSAEMVVDHAILLAKRWGVTGSFIGAMIIGVSTALPELSTALKGLLKKSRDLSLGVLVGSNITNPTLALGLGAGISGYPVDNTVRYFDLPFWLVISLVGLVFFWVQRRVGRVAAGVLVVAYLLFVLGRMRLEDVL